MVVAALGLSACGDGGSATAVQPTDIPATAFETIPITTPVNGTTVSAEGAFQYKVARNDYAMGIANKFKVTLAELAAVNRWKDPNTVALFPGDTILIPANGVKPEETTSGTGTETTDQPVTPEATTPPLETDTTEAKASDGSCNGTYTIKDTDNTRTKVASKFNITVQALDAANAKTKGYKAFYAGLKIVIPRNC